MTGNITANYARGYVLTVPECHVRRKSQQIRQRARRSRRGGRDQVDERGRRWQRGQAHAACRYLVGAGGVEADARTLRIDGRAGWQRERLHHAVEVGDRQRGREARERGVLQRQPGFGVVAERRERDGAGVGKGQRQREVAADAIDAGEEQSAPPCWPADARRELEAPDRRRQIELQPALAQRVARGLQALLQPVVPDGRELPRQASRDEVALAGKLAVEAT